MLLFAECPKHVVGLCPLVSALRCTRATSTRPRPWTVEIGRWIASLLLGLTLNLADEGFDIDLLPLVILLRVDAGKVHALSAGEHGRDAARPLHLLLGYTPTYGST